ncbi:MAG TPA: AMP-binding protein, partial [Mycobacterium sp.]|nr:AMP-binding protein [Mycobacterium sp.]
MYPGLLQVDVCLDGDGLVVVPPTLTLDTLIERCIYSVGNQTAYRYIDFSRTTDGVISEITWNQVGVRAAAVAAAVQRHAHRGDRVAVLAPQGLDYITGFFGAIKAGMVAVPLFAPELAGQAQRLDTAMRDARPAVVLTTTAVLDLIEGFLDRLTGVPRPHVVLLDETPDTLARQFSPVHIDMADVCHLQYSGGATRAPVGIEITHRAMVTNLVQMILAIDLHDRNTHGVSWLPLYHDMGLSMIGFPTVYGGHTTLMSPAAFIRR